MALLGAEIERHPTSVAERAKAMKPVLITGGAGFIGSHVVRNFLNLPQNYRVVNLDKLTYAGNLENLKDVEQNPNYIFEQGDITQREFVFSLFEKYQFEGVVHLAAESHVDRSIDHPGEFVETNVLGTMHLLDAARTFWGAEQQRCFCHVSTDEVFGSLDDEGYFTESSPYDPQSPYAASKAAADHLVRAYHNTYKLPVKLTNCSNNYGSHQFPEKLIPLCINRILDSQSIPVYGEGLNVRDWLYVEDHAKAIAAVYHQGRVGESYNIGGNAEKRNIDLVKLLCRMADLELGRAEGTSEKLITYVKDRPGHDHRYAIDFSKVKSELGWQPTVSFEEGLQKTLRWYLQNKEWVSRVRSGAYREYAHKVEFSAS